MTDNNGKKEFLTIFDSTKDKKHFNSLPLYYNDSDICGLRRPRPGMECLPLGTPTETYHYHVTDQTKSLQELQNEVGALLEFRDLVIETFPDLKQKMASMSTTYTLTGLPSSSLVTRREWEPGIRVKRKITQKENSETTTSLIRSRSNSHSGKKEPKSGEGNGSVVQDSGFSTETSSSKEAHSGSSTTGAVQVNTAINRLPIDADDELLNLLDVIHRKSNRLRDEVEHLQNIERNRFRNKIITNNDTNISPLNKKFQDHVNRLTKEDIQLLRKERDRLLNKLAEMEAETIASRIKSTKLQDKFDEIYNIKKDLEEQLKLALSQKLELNSRLSDLQKQSLNKTNASSSGTIYSRHFASNENLSEILDGYDSKQQTSHHLEDTLNNQLFNRNHQINSSSSINTTKNIILPSNFVPVVPRKSFSDSTKELLPHHINNEQNRYDLNNLGHLDGLVSTPNRTIKVRMLDSKRIAAILLENDVLELQRHLLTLTVQNQLLTQKLEEATKNKKGFIKILDSSKENLDDLRFQLKEKDIELEGTKAQLRILESKRLNHLDFCPDTDRTSSTIILSSRDSQISTNQISTPSMKAMTPFTIDEMLQHSSSTESAQDQTERDNNKIGNETPKRKPSKIPLPGSKGYLAPKPPTGRNPAIYNKNQTNSVKNLSRSTGNLFGKSGPSSYKRDIQQATSLNRPDSAQSIRKECSLGTNSRSSSSSIPISSKSTPSPHKVSSSPLPKPKRDSLTSRVRHLDSLSRVYSTSPSNTNNNNNNNININNSSKGLTNLQKTNSNSKKDINNSFTQGQPKERKQTNNLTVRRVSNASVGRGNIVDIQPSDTDNGKEMVNDINKNKNNKNITKKASLKPAFTNGRHTVEDQQFAQRLKVPSTKVNIEFENKLNTTTTISDEINDKKFYEHSKIFTNKIIKNTTCNLNNIKETHGNVFINGCKFVDKITPEIITSLKEDNNKDHSTANCSEKSIFYQTIQDKEENFRITKTEYAYSKSNESCGSIESNSESEADFSNMISIRHQEAQEEMADMSFIKNKINCWSLESEINCI